MDATATMSFINVILSCWGYSQGLDDEYQEEGKLLGHYTYQEDGESLQSFPVMVTNNPFLKQLHVQLVFMTASQS